MPVRSGLEPAQFYQEFFADRWEAEEIVEVG